MKNQENSRALLRQLLAGKKQKLQLALVNHSDTHSWIVGDSVIKLPKQQVQAHIEQVIADNPFKRVMLMHINREEYLGIMEELEQRY